MDGIGTSLCTVHLLTDLDDLVSFLKDLVRRSSTCNVRDRVTGFPVILESHCEDANSKDKCFTTSHWVGRTVGFLAEEGELVLLSFLFGGLPKGIDGTSDANL